MGYKEYEKYLKEHPDKKSIFNLTVEIEVVLELLVDKNIIKKEDYDKNREKVYKKVLKSCYNKLSKKEKEYIKSINSCNDTFKGLFKM